MSKNVDVDERMEKQKGLFKKRKRREEKGEKNRNGKKKKEGRGRGGGKIVSVDQLAWKKISLQNDEFEDFEEIEGVEVEYVKKDGRDVIQFKALNPKVVVPETEPEETANEPENGFNGELDEEEWQGIPDTAADTEESDHEVENEDELDVALNGFEKLQELEAEVDLPEWSKMRLSSATLQALNKLGFKSPTPIQSLAIPRIMQGHDLIGKATTGSGKTLAFGIPILEHILSQSDSKENSPSALVIAPTRELAKQIVGHLEDIAQCSLGAMTVCNVTGGLAVQKQLRILQKRPSVIVGTPGRLWEVLNNPEMKQTQLDQAIKKIQFLVLDEADRLLQDGHFAEIEKILDFVNGGENKQTLVFSATFQKQLQQKLKGKKTFEGNLLSKDDALEFLLHKLKFREQPPRFVDANPDTTVTTQVHEGIIECGTQEKDLYLYYFLLRYPGRTLVFVNSIDAVRRLVPLLATLHLPANALHSQLQQKQRLHSLEKFKSSSKAILIATDIAARGLDIPHVQHVVHYHLPRTSDTYIHRSGRTARGTDVGVSLLLCAPEETKPLRVMLAKLGKSQFLGRMLDTFPVDRILVGRVKGRVELAQKIVKAGREVQRRGFEEKWLAEAAEDLGVDSDEIDEVINSKGKYGKQKKEHFLKAEVQAWKAELEELLAQPLQSGFSAKYLTSGSVNLADKLLKGDTHEAFLGMDVSSALDDIQKRKGGKRKR